MPPNLYVDLNYTDDNENGILEAEENSILTIKIVNKGKGKAQGLNVTITDDLNDKNLIIKDKIEIPYIEPDKSFTVTIPISAKFYIASNAHKLKISVTEHYGYDMDPVTLQGYPRKVGRFVS